MPAPCAWKWPSSTRTGACRKCAAISASRPWRTGKSVEYYLQLFINGLVVGSIYSLVALGFVIIYKATKVVNFAQGELVMVGAYACFALTVQLQLPFLVAFLATLGFSIVLGLAVERLVLRPMIGE